MKIVLDTNVLISATFWYGDSFKIINELEKENFISISSEEILDEYLRILNSREIIEKTNDKNLVFKQSVDKIRSLSKIVFPKEKINFIEEDSDDNKFIEVAVEGKCDFIISQDKHLINKKNYMNIKIITPKEFLEVLNGYNL